jgi:hypothetical protein
MRRRVRWLSLNFVVFVLLVLGRVLMCAAKIPGAHSRPAATTHIVDFRRR